MILLIKTPASHNAKKGLKFTHAVELAKLNFTYIKVIAKARPGFDVQFCPYKF